MPHVVFLKDGQIVGQPDCLSMTDRSQRLRCVVEVMEKLEL
jgi:hypothetical protein